MKILLVNRFFGGAQIPTGRMAEDVARVLVDDGHEVTALASCGVYEGAAQARDRGTERPKDEETKRQPEGGGLRPETGDRLHSNQLTLDDRTAECCVAAGDRSLGRPSVGWRIANSGWRRSEDRKQL